MTINFGPNSGAGQLYIGGDNIWVFDGTRWVLAVQPAPNTQTVTYPNTHSLWPAPPAPVEPPDPGPSEEEIAEAIESIKRAQNGRQNERRAS